ncbi:MAG: hypothetical protein RTU63_11480 [Candidatus Thorarchaeota archaeon]
MIIPLLVEAAISKSKRELGNARKLALFAGVITGILSGLQILPLAYPFYSFINPEISTPNFIFVHTYFLIPDFVIWDVGVQNILMSPTIVFIFIPVCIVGSLLGFNLGNYFFKKQEREIWTENH